LAPAQRDTWLGALAEPDAVKDKLRQLLGGAGGVETADCLLTLPRLTLGAAEPTPGGAAQNLCAGALVGPYRLIRELGVGGMGQVWLAERADGLLERQVALKLPHLSWGAASFADRMARERNILASLAHPNIARLYDAGLAADGRPFLALEYVDGQFIDAYATAHRLSVRERVQLVVQVARAVAHAHARLVVHRDLKPSNILVDAQGQAHLLDFGIAKLVDPHAGDDPPASQLTQAPGRVLTPDYASPEQIRGDAIGTASDVYSLGVVFYELLTGERPVRLKKGLGDRTRERGARQHGIGRRGRCRHAPPDRRRPRRHPGACPGQGKHRALRDHGGPG
jgi:serine/threonine-protein kinase